MCSNKLLLNKKWVKDISDASLPHKLLLNRKWVKNIRCIPFDLPKQWLSIHFQLLFIEVNISTAWIFFYLALALKS